ncbi:BTB/POZ domain-containing protein 18 [Rousettus aegyptiacus]|uniref:BTB/POZ domain-containing protein 18 n=1 Tax=Rousettus aegyptiacus TaxID=9407 RepID=A0A7J8GWB2_ROUAE|nr:BTB/POZ domain-containing protein 18 [Rousettus aegyptiacus]XP_036077062.1 BTB/POZ domain-containing protein 18 [Rousettus aegyptiacus]KAF6464140.1 BTB domain containing 18 [Rousettus aegyptiacus]
MCSPASSKILYRNPRFLRLAFLELHHQQQSGVFCDVLLQAEGEAVPAHCCILSACSPFFTERLERERPAQGRKVVLELGGLKIRTLRKLVNFLYTSEMEVSREEAQDVLSAARQLRVSELESLQLEGGKLVKAPQGRRLNRECLQPPSAAPISARVVASSRRPRTPLPITQTPCPLGAVRLKSLGMEEGAQDKSSQQNAENLSDTLLLKRKARACPAPQEKSSSPSSHSQGPKENKSDPALGHTALSPPSLYPSTNKRLLPRKIRLSRSKPSPDVCTSKPPSILSGPSSVPTPPGRRLWRQKSINKEAPEDKQKPGRTSPLPSTPSPSGLGKTGGSKKRSPEAKAPNSDSAEGQVGRVKLRKTVNGTCWEVVQEPPPKNSPDSPQIPAPGDSEEPPGTQPSSVNQQKISSARIDVCQDSPVCSRLQDILLSGSHSPDPPVVKSEFGSSPELVGKEPKFDIDCTEPYAFDTSLLGQPCEAEEYGITSAAATSELEEILDFMLCGSDVKLPTGSLESPGAEGCRTPSYHLTETGKNWIEGEEWYLPEVELWPREFTGLEKEPVGENKEPAEPFSPLVMSSANKEPVEPLSPLVMPSEMSEGEVLSVGGSWTQDLEITSSQPLDNQRDKLLHIDSLDPPQRSYGDLSPPCSNWGETGLEVSLTTDEVYSPPETGKEVCSNSEQLDPLPASPEEEEIDVVDWSSEGRLVPTSIPSMWPDPSSESETEVDILT